MKNFPRRILESGTMKSVTASLNNFGVDAEDLGIFTAVLTISGILGIIGKYNPAHNQFTNIIASYEAPYIAAFQSMAIPTLTEFFIFVYVFGYPALLLGAYYFIKRNHEEHFRYVKSYIFLMIVSMPIFFFVPVEVTGMFLEEVEPLLYGHSQWTGMFFSSIGDFQKALPSLHTGFSALAAFSISHHSKRAGLVAWKVTGLIVLSTFYLGIHWMTDALIGLILAYISYRIFH